MLTFLESSGSDLTNSTGFWVALILIVLVVLFVSCLRVVPQAHAYIMERFGGYQETWSVGIHLKWPFIDRVALDVLLKEQVVDFPPQPVITKDNVTMQIDTVVYFQITDPKLYAYGVQNPLMAIENLTATTLRNIIGDLELDETLTSREIINGKMRVSLDEATDPWGIKVNRVELKNIMPPAAIRDAMEKQMKAERERRESILIAEGEKESKILRAQAEKEAKILEADAKKQARIMAADAEKAAYIAEGEGKAKAIELINKADPSAKYITLEGYEALKKVADGQSTKIVVPTELSNVAGILASVKEIVTDKKPAEKK